MMSWATRMVCMSWLAGAIALPASAQMRELGQGELRDLVGAGQALGLPQALALVQERVDGKFVDVRAFEDDTVYYRVIIKRPDGQLVAAIVDARVGRLISGRSSTAQEVMAAARTKAGNGGKRGGPNGSGKSKTSGGKGNSGGGNGNSGGGNGNSGGGNGNSGGNSGGNSNRP